MPAALEPVLAPPQRSRAGALPWRGLLQGALAFAASAALFSALGRWHDAQPLPPGVDPVLQSLPYWGEDWLLSWVWIGFHPLVLAAWLRGEPRRVPWQLYMLSFWVAVRAVFVALNPVGPPPGMVPIYDGRALLESIRGRFIFDSELFFSGHTGLPFLYALLARPGPLRAACLAFSALMGAGVLLTRNHFVIDVLGAYFMTYSIWALGRRLLARWEPA